MVVTVTWSTPSTLLSSRQYSIISLTACRHQTCPSEPMPTAVQVYYRGPHASNEPAYNPYIHDPVIQELIMHSDQEIDVCFLQNTPGGKYGSKTTIDGRHCIVNWWRQCRSYNQEIDLYSVSTHQPRKHGSQLAI